MSFNANTGKLYGNYSASQPTPINYLINAADSIFSTAIRLKEIEASPIDCNDLKNHLVQEIKNFAKLADNSKKYDSSIIKNACFILADFIDDTINATAWGKNNNWENQSLLCTFPEIAKDQSFFSILKSAAENPFSNLDLLEMAYLCLNLGYEGKYRNSEQGSNILAVAKADLYKYLAKHRYDDGTSLLVCDHTTTAQTNDIIEKIKIKKPSIIVTAIAIFAIVLAISIHAGLNAKLNNSLSSITKITQSITFNS